MPSVIAHRHAKPCGAAGHCFPDPPHADNPQSPAGDVRSQELRGTPTGPATGSSKAIPFDDTACCRQEQRPGKIRSSIRQDVRSVRDDQATLSSGSKVDIIVPDGIVRQNLESNGGMNGLCVDAVQRLVEVILIDDGDSAGIFGEHPQAVLCLPHVFAPLDGIDLLVDVQSFIGDRLEQRQVALGVGDGDRREVALLRRPVVQGDPAHAGEEQLDFHGEHYDLTLMNPLFDPGPIEWPDVPVQLAAVNSYMARIGGRVADGVRPHPICTRRYLEQVLRPAVDLGLSESGREEPPFEVVASPLIATGPDDSSVKQRVSNVRARISFYASTRTYEPVLAAHGWQDVGPQLHRKSVEGDWKGMADLITDEMLDTYAVTGTWETIAARLQERYAGLLDRTAFYQPDRQQGLDDPRLPRLIKEFNG